MRKKLIVVDMQKDFTFGSLRNEMAIDVIDNVVKKVENYDGEIIFTYDSHQENYLETAEGIKLPIPHCIENSEGWELVDRLDELRREKHCRSFNKPTFGCLALAEALKNENDIEKIDEIELVGVCTDICVISNAMILKAFLPEVTIKVDGTCCAGITVESHKNALEAMKSCQIEVTDEAV